MTADETIEIVLPQKQTHSIVPASRHAFTNAWNLSDAESDLIIKVGSVSYALHKAPLVSRCGLLRMLVAEGTEQQASKVDLEGIPGGAEGFELAAKFCYGMLPEINKNNVALLRCVAEFLDMSEDREQAPSLISLTGNYLERVLSKHSFKDVVTVLHTCESLSPLSEEIGVVNQFIECIVTMVLHNDNKRANEGHHTLITFHEFQHNMNNNIDWWVEDISMLGIKLFQRVLDSLQKRGLKTEAIGHALMYYAQKTLKNLTKKGLQSSDHGDTKSKFLPHDVAITVEHEQRVVVETIVSLLPHGRNIPINFLIGMLRIAHILDTTLACRLDLEKRIASQLHKATLDDLLLPSQGTQPGEGFFDISTIHNLVLSFIEQHKNQDEYNDDEGEDASADSRDDGLDGLNSTSVSHCPLVKVGKLVDGYLAEVAADANLPLSKFLGLAELLPAHARPDTDGLYRAVDIFMKTHVSMTDVEKKKICRIIDFQKLTPEASTHAAQNERLPVQAIVQVLYFEQMRIRNVMAGSHFPHSDEHPSPQGHHHPRLSPHGFSPHGHHLMSLHSPDSANLHYSHGSGNHITRASGTHSHTSHSPFSGHYEDLQRAQSSPGLTYKINNNNLCADLSPRDQYASVRLENRELKQEVARMKMRLNELEKSHPHTKQDLVQDEKGHHQLQHVHNSYNYNRQQEDHKADGGSTQPHQQHHSGFFHAFSKSLSKLNPFQHHKLAPAPAPVQTASSAISKRRVNSISTNEQSKRESANHKPNRRHSSST
ncbi:hypothetical protein KP509_03G082100 [Ceratopteris richardii]|nr:hypothetical protein KP509_03G082100 [Ceratopteris richardii]